jgi:perosamine synthetase
MQTLPLPPGEGRGEGAVLIGSPRSDFLPYSRHDITDDDIAAVVEVLQSDWLTTGPKVEQFETALGDYVGSRHAVAVSSGTAALHAALAALQIGPGDDVIVPALTFVATANAVVYQGATPVFADVQPKTLLLDPDAAAALVTRRTRAIVAVDYAGQPCDYARLRKIASRHGLALVADACHSLGAAEAGVKVGSLADVSTFSFHPVKPITCGEGGAVTTCDAALARRIRRFRNHGLDSDHLARQAAGTHHYRQLNLGFNYRLSDLQCALAQSQLARLEGYVAARQGIADCYRAALADDPHVAPLAVRPAVQHAWHLFVVQLRRGGATARDALFRSLRAQGLGVNVHYPPVHLQPYYRERFGTRRGLCPVAERVARRVLSLPIFPRMTAADIARVLGALDRATAPRRRRAA